MGIDFSHGDAHWSYGGFNRFRSRVASMAGFDLGDMIGFGGSTSWDAVTDAIKDLLDHSDCVGELTPEQCKTIAPRLREIVQAWPDDNYDKHQALKLADGMDEAATVAESLVFC
jgi:hypothetical protein